jgi:hypothetical protein
MITMQHTHARVALRHLYDRCCVGALLTNTCVSTWLLELQEDMMRRQASGEEEVGLRPSAALSAAAAAAAAVDAASDD